MQRLSDPTETVLSKKITRNNIVLSFKDSPRKPLGQRPMVAMPLHKSGIIPAIHFLSMVFESEEIGVPDDQWIPPSHVSSM